jgi:hypothetical protein
MAWDKIKSLFVVTESKSGAGVTSADELAALDAELAKFKLPEDVPAALPADTSPEQLAGNIDFQGLYDQAGIPNTDEVEALEKFLGGLETSLPQSSKLAAAKAFLGAIGKSPQDVLNDAGRKIQVVRGVEEAKKNATQATRQAHEQSIAELQAKIEEHRAAIEGALRDHENVKTQCVVEESRLQAARIFFGGVESAPAPAAKP